MARQQHNFTNKNSNKKRRIFLKKYLLTNTIFWILIKRVQKTSTLPKPNTTDSSLTKNLDILKNNFVTATNRASQKTKPVKNYLVNSSLFELGNNFFTSFISIFKNYPIHTIAIVMASMLILVGTSFVFEEIFRDLPQPEQLTNHNPAVTTKILDRNERVLYRIYEDENRTIIPLEEIPPQVIFAVIAIEDKEFFDHYGFSVSGIVRAAIANFNGETIEQGGSTLTQQLVKNRLLTPDRTISRKIRELLIAIMTEQQYSKEEILEMYLNQVAFGGSAYGIEEAAQRYFGKSAKNLSLAEAAVLAGLPAAPSAYSPFGPQPEHAFRRQEEVLRRMQEDGYITAEQAETALKQPVAFRKNVIDIDAPHFVMYVRELLAKEYGEEILLNGGLTVKTSLDLRLQKQAQQIVSEEVERLQRLRIGNGAAIITNPKTGEVLSMVGSTDYFNFENDGQVNVTLRPRQPGSSIKPLTYALALENGFTPTSVIEDTPVTYNFRGSPPYSPVNYDGTYHGRVTLREALGSSYNIPAVKTLNTLGVSNLIDKAEEMGITTWNERNRFGLSLTLGGGEVLMTDMATMYGVFANNGKRVDLNPILEITDYTGEVLYRNECALDGINCQGEQVLSPGVAYQISHILSDNAAREPAFGPMSTLYIPNQEVAVKTGTTNNLRDNWTIGYTNDQVVTVWVGNNDNTPMSYVASGVTGASPIWNSLIRLQLSDESPHAFAVPEQVEKVSVCSYTGRTSCSWCRSTREEVFLEGTVPRDNCRAPAPEDQVASPNQEASPVERQEL